MYDPPTRSMATAEADQAVTGKKLRAARGAQVASEISRITTELGRLGCALPSVLLVTAKQMSAMIASATATRSRRPRRSHRGRGAGGAVTPAAMSAAILRLVSGLGLRPEVIGPA